MSKEFNKATLDAIADMATDDVYESADELFDDVLKMRTETDDFRYIEDPAMDMVRAEIDTNKNVCVEFYNDDWLCETVFLTKQQAAEFARQILEMCGEVKNES